MSVSKAKDAARLLVSARRTGDTLDNLPSELRATTQAEAHAIQDAMLAELGPVGAWKIPAGDDPAPFLSPLPASEVHGQGYIRPLGPLPIVIAELEIGVRLVRDLPLRARTPYQASEMGAAIASLHPLIELITFSWTDRDQVDRLTQLSDLQNSAALVVGDSLNDWQEFAADTTELRLLLDDTVVASTASGAGMGQILSTLAYLANHAAERGLALQAGQIVTTGARLVAPVGGATRISGEIAGLGTVWTMLERAKRE